MNLNTPEVALLVLACLLVGYGLAELFRRRTTTPQNPQTQNTQSAPQPTTAEDMVENRIAMEDPAPPANAGKSVGYRLYIQRDNMSGKIVLVQRTKWGEDAPETQPVLSTNISVETTEEDARFARIREELEELRRERVAASAQPSPAPAIATPAPSQPAPTTEPAPPPIVVPAGTAPATP